MTMHRTWVGGLAVLAAATLSFSGCSTSGSEGSGSSTPPASAASSAQASTSGASAPLWPEPGAGELPASATKSMQAILDGWVESAGLNGVTAAVVTADGTWAGAAGEDGAGEELQPDSAMYIASMTKTFTAAEVMLLASRGLVDLDAPLTDYIEVPFDTQGATVRQVLGMRSGFPDIPFEFTQDLIEADLDREWTVTEMLAELPEDTTRMGTLGGPPRYNPINYQLLSEVIAKITKQPVAQAVRADLLDPAGLPRTWTQAGEAPTVPLSVGTDPPGTTLVATGPYLPSRSLASFWAGGASMASDTADLARWGYLLYGGHVIDSALVAQMEAGAEADQSGVPYALGTQVLTDASGATFVGHAGGGPNYPYTGNLSVWTADPQVAVAVLTPQPADFPTQIYDLVMQLHQAAAQ